MLCRLRALLAFVSLFLAVLLLQGCAATAAVVVAAKLADAASSSDFDPPPDISSTDWRRRRSAVKEMTDQVQLERIAQTDPADVVRQAAVGKLASKELLGRIALTDPDPEGWIRVDAIAAISDQQVFAKAATEDKKANVRKAAVAKLTDQTTLANVVVRDDERSIRKAAMEKLTDDSAIADAAGRTSHDDDAVQLAGRLTDQNALAGLIIEMRSRQGAQKLLAKLTDQEALLKVALQSQSLNARGEVTGRLTPETKERLVEGMFLKAQAANSEPAYREFMSRFPKTSQAERAEAGIRRIRFEHARANDDIDSYVAFVVAYPGGADASEALRRIGSKGRWPMARRLGELALDTGPAPVMQFSLTPFVGGGTTGRMDSGGITLRPRSPLEVFAVMLRFDVLLRAGADPAAVRIVSAQRRAGDRFDSGSPDRVVPAGKGGLTLMQYFKKHDIQAGILALQRHHG
jgi:hypothetical protein